MAAKAMLALFGALLLGGTARAEDITARYILPTLGDAVMIVQVDDRGNSRIGVAGETAVITTGGVAYFVTTDEAGPVVVRRDDALAAMNEVLDAALVDAGAVRAGTPIGLREGGPADGGPETIAGYAGRRWILSDPEPPPVFLTDIVLSDDPALVPIGRALAALAVESTGIGGSVGASGLVVSGPPAVLALLRSGTILRFADLARLESVSHAPVPPSTFVLPAPPITRAAYAERLRQGRSPPP